MKPETLGEVHILLTNLGEKLDAHMENSQKSYEQIMECIGELNKTCDLTLQQALKTNGRVNLIEPLALDYQEKRARARGAVAVIALIGMSVLGAWGFVVNSYIDYKTDKIMTSIIDVLETNYKIEIK